jgi:hypothetical protein
MVDLAESLDGILGAIATALDAAAVTDGSLAEVRQIVRGDRARPQPKMPALWVVPDEARSDDTSLGLAEVWEMPVHLIALVKDDDPEAGKQLAIGIAARARTVVLRQRRLRPPLTLGYVNDIVSTAFDPGANRGPQNRVLAWADATVTVRWRTTPEGES